ncbi:cadmium resistance transporter [Clostridium pasteurianum]|uniref:cadmium resistance transporter n=1 Tax=Clostridium pasteurianum TaxID=1501 RepID=UPI002260DFC0|nr:cadmium resistance transporter [Clostridium pasteurianum]UZW14895.1 cadmium resistance transporter [Clostridium pasteurianum]
MNTCEKFSHIVFLTYIFYIYIILNIFKVASVTMANGGDNIGIYIPFFFSISVIDILAMLEIFILISQ